jgi:uncharacterized paraquat-inducible protein A
MVNKKAKPRQRATIACCRPCGRTFEMTGTARQLRQEGALKCPRCKASLSVVMEVERL